jgi:hypothetical protein
VVHHASPGVRGPRRSRSRSGYGCARLLEDFLRIDKRFGPLTGSQWTALTVVVVSVAV